MSFILLKSQPSFKRTSCLMHIYVKTVPYYGIKYIGFYFSSYGTVCIIHVSWFIRLHSSLIDQTYAQSWEVTFCFWNISMVIVKK